MGFAFPKWRNRLTIFRANDSCWRSKCVDRSFIMLSYIWVRLRGALSSAVRVWISGMAALRPAVPRDALGLFQNIVDAHYFVSF